MSEFVGGICDKYQVCVCELMVSSTGNVNLYFKTLFLHILKQIWWKKWTNPLVADDKSVWSSYCKMRYDKGLCVIAFVNFRYFLSSSPPSSLGGVTYQWENFKVVFWKSTLYFLIAFVFLVTKNKGVWHFDSGKWEFWPCVVLMGILMGKLKKWFFGNKIC